MGPPDLDAVLAAMSPANFSREHFGWTPYPYQAEVMDAILREGARRVAWVAGRRVGKTDTIANVALQLAVKRPGIKIGIFAPTIRQARILASRCKYLLAGSRFERLVVVDNLSELRLRFGTDARGKPVESVIFANSITGKVRGEGADVLIVDESAFCGSEDYRNKALPFIADRPDAIVIHISTVSTDDDHFAEALRLYPTLPHGRVFRTPTRLKPGVTEEMLAEFRRTMLDSEYRREYECEIVPESGVFDRRALEACLKDYELLGLDDLPGWRPKRHHAYTVGVDWAKKRDRAVIAVVEQGTHELANPARVVFLQVYEADPENPRHYTRVLHDVERIARHVGAHRIVADEGEGAHQAEVLRRAFGGRFSAFRFTAGSRDELVDNARMLVETRAVELPREPDDVRKAFANVHRTEKGYEHASRKTKDVFDAIAMALREASEARAREGRGPMRIASVEPRSTGWERRGTVALDPKKVFFPPEAWKYMR